MKREGETVGESFISSAEYRLPDPKMTTEGAPVMEQGWRVWKPCREIEFDSVSFQEMGLDFKKEYEVKKGKIGAAGSR